MTQLAAKAISLTLCFLAVAKADYNSPPVAVEVIEWIDKKDGSDDSIIVFECSDGSRMTKLYKKSKLIKVNITQLMKELDERCQGK